MRHILIVLALLPGWGFAQPGLELFEREIRPYLVDHCYECHHSHGKAKGGLRLDSRSGMLDGGERGPVLVAGKPDQSLLIEALRHTRSDLKMPKGGARADAAVLAHFERWISLGAPDPRDTPPTSDEHASLTQWENVLERRKLWWSFQPIQPGTHHRIDDYLAEAQRSAGLEAAPIASKQTLIRRWFFVLTGLPPSVADLQRLADSAPGAIVDELLASPAFAERWARHWMDWWRYADTHGSEGDPAVPYASQYRDYLIRAWQQDVPYDQLLREHLAGDLLPEPRLNQALGINESAIGPAHLRMVFHGFAPTDALDELVRFTDNQIDVVTKASLGLTVSCARCHNHKFDPISQRDFYALFGVFASGRPAVRTVSVFDQAAVRDEMRAVKLKIKNGLAQAWIKGADRFPGSTGPWTVPLKEAASDKLNPLYAWARGNGVEDLEREAAADQAWQARYDAQSKRAAWDLRKPTDFRDWVRHGRAVEEQDAPWAAGGFNIPEAGQRIIGDLYPGGVYSHLVSSKDNACLSSPRFEMSDAIWVKVAGGKQAMARYVVQNYPRNGTVYPIKNLNTPGLTWVKWDTQYWSGDQAYVEVSTAADQPVLAKPQIERSWFGIQQAVVMSSEDMESGLTPGLRFSEFSGPLITAEGDLKARYQQALRTSAQHWLEGRMSDAEANFLGYFVRNGLLPVTVDELPALAPLLSHYRTLEQSLKPVLRAPGVVEHTPFDQPFYERGDHKQPGERVPRSFLDAFGAREYGDAEAGRRALAEDLLAPDNPLTTRVLVNRLWHHVFGRGLVHTPDNFGKLGAKPSHPALLDILAARFQSEGWSMKKAIRHMVLSDAFMRQSPPSDLQRTRDPENKLLSHFSMRRLEGEAIRDSLLAVSGKLDRTQFGPGQGSTSARRSIYLRVIRNKLDPLLSTFDYPEPLTTRGQRDNTNVPAQSLALLNDPWIFGLAKAWGDRVRSAAGSEDEKIMRMFLAATARHPQAQEVAAAKSFLQEAAQPNRKAELLHAQWGQELTAHRASLTQLLKPVRERLTEQVLVRPDPNSKKHWVFDQPLELGGDNFEATPALNIGLTEKTLAALVQPADVTQRGGGVMSLQTLGGAAFDAIVFGEKNEGEWMAGSDHFRRTRRFGGARERGGEPVLIALTYAADGTITAYRNGVRYGNPIKTDGPVTFGAGKAQVLFGLRHLPPGGNRFFRGTLHEAWLFDRALSAEEVESLNPGVSEAAVIAALSAVDQERVVELKAAMKNLERRIQELPEEAPVDPWRDLAHALFNMKEFIYVH